MSHNPTHWTIGFDWENAWYVLRDCEGNQRGPFKGRQATFDAINPFREAHAGSDTEIVEASHQCHVASVWHDGSLMLVDLRDDEGEHLPMVPW